MAMFQTLVLSMSLGALANSAWAGGGFFDPHVPQNVKAECEKLNGYLVDTASPYSQEIRTILSAVWPHAVDVYIDTQSARLNVLERKSLITKLKSQPPSLYVIATLQEVGYARIAYTKEDGRVDRTQTQIVLSTGMIDATLRGHRDLIAGVLGHEIIHALQTAEELKNKRLAEQAADRLSARATDLAGYNPRGLMIFFEMKAREAKATRSNTTRESLASDLFKLADVHDLNHIRHLDLEKEISKLGKPIPDLDENNVIDMKLGRFYSDAKLEHGFAEIAAYIDSVPRGTFFEAAAPLKKLKSMLLDLPLLGEHANEADADSKYFKSGSLNRVFDLFDLILEEHVLTSEDHADFLPLVAEVITALKEVIPEIKQLEKNYSWFFRDEKFQNFDPQLFNRGKMLISVAQPSFDLGIIQIYRKSVAKYFSLQKKSLFDSFKNATDVGQWVSERIDAYEEQHTYEGRKIRRANRQINFTPYSEQGSGLKMELAGIFTQSLLDHLLGELLQKPLAKEDFFAYLGKLAAVQVIERYRLGIWWLLEHKRQVSRSQSLQNIAGESLVSSVQDFSSIIKNFNPSEQERLLRLLAMIYFPDTASDFYKTLSFEISDVNEQHISTFFDGAYANHPILKSLTGFSMVNDPAEIRAKAEAIRGLTKLYPDSKSGQELRSLAHDIERFGNLIHFANACLSAPLGVLHRKDLPQDFSRLFTPEVQTIDLSINPQLHQYLRSRLQLPKQKEAREPQTVSWSEDHLLLNTEAKTGSELARSAHRDRDLNIAAEQWRIIESYLVGEIPEPLSGVEVEIKAVGRYLSSLNYLYHPSIGGFSFLLPRQTRHVPGIRPVILPQLFRTMVHGFTSSFESNAVNDERDTRFAAVLSHVILLDENRQLINASADIKQLTANIRKTRLDLQDFEDTIKSYGIQRFLMEKKAFAQSIFFRKYPEAIQEAAIKKAKDFGFDHWPRSKKLKFLHLLTKSGNATFLSDQMYLSILGTLSKGQLKKLAEQGILDNLVSQHLLHPQLRAKIASLIMSTIPDTAAREAFVRREIPSVELRRTVWNSYYEALAKDPAAPGLRITKGVYEVIKASIDPSQTTVDVTRETSFQETLQTFAHAFNIGIARLSDQAVAEIAWYLSSRGQRKLSSKVQKELGTYVKEIAHIEDVGTSSEEQLLEFFWNFEPEHRTRYLIAMFAHHPTALLSPDLKAWFSETPIFITEKHQALNSLKAIIWRHMHFYEKAGVLAGVLLSDKPEGTLADDDAAILRNFEHLGLVGRKLAQLLTTHGSFIRESLREKFTKFRDDNEASDIISLITEAEAHFKRDLDINFWDAIELIDKILGAGSVKSAIKGKAFGQGDIVVKMVDPIARSKVMRSLELIDAAINEWMTTENDDELRGIVAYLLKRLKRDILLETDLTLEQMNIEKHNAFIAKRASKNTTPVSVIEGLSTKNILTMEYIPTRGNANRVAATTLEHQQMVHEMLDQLFADGFAHGDLQNPANILLLEKGPPALIDLSLSVPVAKDDVLTTLKLLQTIGKDRAQATEIFAQMITDAKEADALTKAKRCIDAFFALQAQGSKGLRLTDFVLTMEQHAVFLDDRFMFIFEFIAILTEHQSAALGISADDPKAITALKDAIMARLSVADKLKLQYGKISSFAKKAGTPQSQVTEDAMRRAALEERRMLASKAYIERQRAAEEALRQSQTDSRPFFLRVSQKAGILADDSFMTAPSNSLAAALSAPRKFDRLVYVIGRPLDIHTKVEASRDSLILDVTRNEDAAPVYTSSIVLGERRFDSFPSAIIAPQKNARQVEVIIGADADAASMVENGDYQTLLTLLQTLWDKKPDLHITFTLQFNAAQMTDLWPGDRTKAIPLNLLVYIAYRTWSLQKIIHIETPEQTTGAQKDQFEDALARALTNTLRSSARTFLESLLRRMRDLQESSGEGEAHETTPAAIGCHESFQSWGEGGR